MVNGRMFSGGHSYVLCDWKLLPAWLYIIIQCALQYICDLSTKIELPCANAYDSVSESEDQAPS